MNFLSILNYLGPAIALFGPDYIRHEEVIKERRNTMEMRIVYDASAKVWATLFE